MVPTDSSSSSSTGLPVPTPVRPPQPAPATSHWLRRSVGALASGRLPYRLQGPVDSLLARAGLRYRRLDTAGMRVVIRRNAAWDENAVLRVIGDRDYAKPGHEIRPGDTVIDIGGNIGCFTLVAAKAASQGRVLVFEPDRDNFDLILKNVALNGFTNVTAERCAVAGEPGTLKLFRGDHGPLHSTTASRLEGAEVSDEVPAVTLPDIMDRHKVERCHFLKMNCEGAEYGILYKTPAEYLRRIDRIALEYHASPGQDKARIARELAGYLRDQGFDIFEFTDFVGYDCGYIRGTRRS